MKIVRVKYTAPYGPMIQDLERVFPEYAPITAGLLQSLGGFLINPAKKRFVYLQEFYSELGVRTKVVVYALVRDSFTVPAWIQGQVLKEIDLATEPVLHQFLGHEIPVPDNPNEPPEEVIA
jgi:hypothetical protein